MILVIQRVQRATVRNLESGEERAIGPGLVVLVGFERGDTPAVFPKVVRKVYHLRVFEDEQGKLNRSLQDLGYEVLWVSNFTLAGSIDRGRRPDFFRAMPFDEARQRFEELLAEARRQGFPAVAGFYGAHMAVELVNDGPVTLVWHLPPEAGS